MKIYLDRHENVIWEFIHKIYIKDDQHLFLNLIKWIEKYLTMMRIKFINPEIVKINIHTPNSGGGGDGDNNNLDKQLFMNQLNSRVQKLLQNVNCLNILKLESKLTTTRPKQQ